MFWVAKYWEMLVVRTAKFEEDSAFLEDTVLRSLPRRLSKAKYSKYDYNVFVVLIPFVEKSLYLSLY